MFYLKVKGVKNDWLTITIFQVLLLVIFFYYVVISAFGWKKRKEVNRLDFPIT